MQSFGILYLTSDVENFVDDSFTEETLTFHFWNPIKESDNYCKFIPDLLILVYLNVA